VTAERSQRARGGGGVEQRALERRKTPVEATSERISLLEEVLLNRIERDGLPKPERQVRFCPARRWRADFAYSGAMLLIEVDGGTWTGGRHVRGKGFEADCEKTSTAAAMGWRVLRFTREMIEDGRAVALIRQALEAA
jgi:very-short-patch-repair endonuclease